MATETVPPVPTENKTQVLQRKAGESALRIALDTRGIDESQWNTLKNSLFPGAKNESVMLVIDYCRARKLDPMKKPCHIVPMRVKNATTGDFEWRDVVMPGIYEYRTTAMRTGRYLGHSAPAYGPLIKVYGVEAPEWCSMEFYRALEAGVADPRIAFPVTVYFREVCTTKFDKEKKEHLANDRWERAPIQMLTKVTEAAGLREAFPDEFGGEATVDEMAGRTIGDEDAGPAPAPAPGFQRLSEQATAGALTAAPATPHPAQTAAALQQEGVDRQRGMAPIAAAARLGAAQVAAAVVQEDRSRGVIIDVVEREVNGMPVALVKLSTGFMATTSSAEIIAAAKRIKAVAPNAEGRKVELMTRPSVRPGAPPVIESIE